MQHAGLQYGQGAANSHQSPPFAHTDAPHSIGGNTTSSLRQFRKKETLDKPGSEINSENSHVARVAPHNHYPAGPNDFYRYRPQYTDYGPQVKYSEIAESPQNLQHVDHIVQKHKDKEYMDMCSIPQQSHQNHLGSRHQVSYPNDASIHHSQYLHKESHQNYKPESHHQFLNQQYAHQLNKYNVPTQCRKYPAAPPPENDFLAKLQRINPTMARSIMSDHHIRESHQTTYPTMDQSRMYAQNQRYYNSAYPHSYPQQYAYPSCNYPRSNQVNAIPRYPPSGGISPRRNYPSDNLSMINYGAVNQKVSPNYQYNPTPEYAQHYQHRRTNQDYFQQACRASQFLPNQISPEPSDNRASSELRHYLETWEEEEGSSADISHTLYEDNLRSTTHKDQSSSEPVFVNIPPQCLENGGISLVATENGQYIIKSTIENPVRLIESSAREEEEGNERVVSLQILEAAPKSDCLLSEKNTEEESSTKSKLDCLDLTSNAQNIIQAIEEIVDSHAIENNPKFQENSTELDPIKDMPIIDEEDHKNNPNSLTEHLEAEEDAPQEGTEPNQNQVENEAAPTKPEKHSMSQEKAEIKLTKRNQRIFSVDDIINNIGSCKKSANRRSSLQLTPTETPDLDFLTVKKAETPEIKDRNQEESETDQKEAELKTDENQNQDVQYRNAICVEDNSVILEIAGVLVQLNINSLNGSKVLSVLPLSESILVDVNSSEDSSRKVQSEDKQVQTTNEDTKESEIVNQDVLSLDGHEEPQIEGNPQVEELEKVVEDHLETVNINDISRDDLLPSEIDNEVIIGGDNFDNEVTLDFDKIEGEENLIEDSTGCLVDLKGDDQAKLKGEPVESLESSPRVDPEAILESSSRVEPEAILESSSRVEPEAILESSSRFEPEAILDTDKKELLVELERIKVNSFDSVTESPIEPPNQAQSVVEEIRIVVESKKSEEELKKVATLKKTEVKVQNVCTKAAKKLYSTEIMSAATQITERKVKHQEKRSKDQKRLKVASSSKRVHPIKERFPKLVKPPVKVEKEMKVEQIDKNQKGLKKVTFCFPDNIEEVVCEKIDQELKLSQAQLGVNSKSLLLPPVDVKPKERKLKQRSNGDLLNHHLDSKDLGNNRRKLSLKEYNSRKKTDNTSKITVESSQIPNLRNCWEDQNLSQSHITKNQIATKCVIDANEFNIEPMRLDSCKSNEIKSYNSSEDDSLQMYKEVVHSKLNSLSIKIPKLNKPKPLPPSPTTTKKICVLMNRFLSEGVLNCNELAKVKKIIECKRKIEEDLQKSKEGSLKVPEANRRLKRRKRRFRNLYTDETDDDSCDSGDKSVVGDYSVYQRNSQAGVPKLIFKRKLGLPQPFVRLERSQAAELLVKKRKLY